MFTFTDFDLHSDDHLPLKSSVRSRIYNFLDKRDNHVEEPPNGGLAAWLQVVGCFFIFMNNFGLVSAFGVYQAYYEEIMLPHYSASSISWIGTLQASLLLIVGIAAGPLFDKGYFFSTVVAASVGLVLSFMLLSMCHEYWQVLLCQGLLGGICTGMLYIPSIAQIPQYFTTKKGTAVGLVLSGAPFGGIIYPYMFRTMLPQFGFAWATRSIGLLALILLAISIILVKPLQVANRPRKLRDPTMFKDPYYVCYVIAAFLAFAGLMIPYFDCATFWAAKFDLNIDHAFYTLLIINGGNFVGRILLSSIVDLGAAPETLMVICIAVCTVLGFAWTAVDSAQAYHTFLVLWGVFSGGVAALPALMLPYLAPRPEVFATRLGVIYAGAGVGVLIGPPIANATRRTDNDFVGVQIWTGATCAAALGFGLYSARGARRNRLALMTRQAVVSRQDSAVDVIDSVDRADFQWGKKGPIVMTQEV